MVDTVIRLEELPKIKHAEWQELGVEVDRSFVDTLRSLSSEEWNTLTECPPWTVKDVIAHLIGWAEATINPVELSRQTLAGFRLKKSHDGNWLDAANQFQVDTRSPMTTDELIARFEQLAPRFHKVRSRYGLVTGIFPMKEPFSGTWVPVRFLFDTIFVRDHFMHHIDICTALGRELPVGDAERRIAHDAIREWAEKAKADVTLELSGPAGGRFVHGSGATTITGNAIDLCRTAAGRRCEPFEIPGDSDAANRWLTQLAAF
jgi:uncharacterized protein (TIGR03083 family)